MRPNLTANEWRANDELRAWLQDTLKLPPGRELMGLILDFVSSPRTGPLDMTYALGVIHGRREVYNLLVSLSEALPKPAQNIEASYARKESQPTD